MTLETVEARLTSFGQLVSHLLMFLYRCYRILSVALWISLCQFKKLNAKVEEILVLRNGTHKRSTVQKIQRWKVLSIWCWASIGLPGMASPWRQRHDQTAKTRSSQRRGLPSCLPWITLWAWQLIRALHFAIAIVCIYFLYFYPITILLLVLSLYLKLYHFVSFCISMSRFPFLPPDIGCACGSCPESWRDHGFTQLKAMSNTSHKGARPNQQFKWAGISHRSSAVSSSSSRMPKCPTQDLDEIFFPSFHHFWPRKDFWPNAVLLLLWDETEADHVAAQQLHEKWVARRCCGSVASACDFSPRKSLAVCNPTWTWEILQKSNLNR